MKPSLKVLGCFFVLQYSASLFGRVSTETDVGDATLSDVRDYCPPESFDAACGPNEVLLIRSALYGRMRVGRCVKFDLGYVGCSADVTRILASRCSGRRTCSISLVDDELERGKACPKDLPSYLEASYACLEALDGQANTCQTAVDVTTSSTYIGIANTSSAIAADQRCPWTLSALDGQRIQVRLVGFYSTRQRQAGSSADRCVQLGSVLDGGKTSHLSFCVGVRDDPVGDRDRLVYESSSSRIELTLNVTSPHDDALLVRYRADGCPTMRPPPGAFGRRTGDRLVVRCSETDAVWTLFCRDNRWNTRSGNCTTFGTHQDAVVRCEDTGEVWTMMCGSGCQKVTTGNSVIHETQKDPTGRNTAAQMSVMIAAAVSVTALGIFLSRV